VNPDGDRVFPPFLVGAALALVLALSGCSGAPNRPVRGEAPLVALDSLSVDDHRLIAGIRLVNLNDRPLEFDELGLKIVFGGRSSLTVERWPATFALSARGREVFEVPLEVDLADHPGLVELRNGAIERLSWSLILTHFRGKKSIELARGRGYLHPVPGSPDRFR